MAQIYEEKQFFETGTYSRIYYCDFIMQKKKKPKKKTTKQSTENNTSHMTRYQWRRVGLKTLKL